MCYTIHVNFSQSFFNNKTQRHISSYDQATDKTSSLWFYL